MKDQGVICLCYHRVNPLEEKYSIPPELFENQLNALLSRGYRTISIANLIDFLSGKPLAMERPILLSFDDGFLDFYVYAYPLLQKYKMNAVVFLVTDWMNEDNSIGPKSRIPAEPGNFTLDQAVKSALKGDRRLFLSWEMAQEMAKSGLIEFGSHGLSHRIGFRCGRVKKFIRSREAYWKFHQIYEGEIKPGLPIFEQASALAVRRFLPRKEALEQLIEYCRNQMQSSANSDKELKAGLRKFAEKLAPLGDYESENDARARILAELKGSKDIIENRLGLACPSLSWPFGYYSGLAIELAQQAGYKIAFSTERGAIRLRDNRFSLKRNEINAIPGARLAWELLILKNRLADRIINGRPRSRQVVQEFSEMEKSWEGSQDPV